MHILRRVKATGSNNRPFLCACVSVPACVRATVRRWGSTRVQQTANGFPLIKHRTTLGRFAFTRKRTVTAEIRLRTNATINKGGGEARWWERKGGGEDVDRERDGYNRFTSLHHSSLLLECVCAQVCACACTCVHMSTCKKLTCFPLLIHTKLGHMLTQLLLSSLVILHFPLSLTPFPTPPRHFSPPHPPKSGFLSTFTTQNYWTTHLRAD